MSPSPSLLVAQITDTHLFAKAQQELKGCATGHSLKAVLEKLSQVQPQPQILLMTGDLSQDETIASYEQLRDQVTPLGIPTYWIPGNHDQTPVEMAAVLSTALISPQKSFQQGGWQFILLDTSLPHQVHGALSEGDLANLEKQLQQAPEMPTLIALHHHPLLIESACMDAIALQNPEDLFAIVDRHPQVKLVIFGHIHQEFDQTRQGVRYLGSPSTCVQLKPKSDEVTWSDEPPGFRLLRLYPDGGFESWVERVEVEGGRRKAEG